jgi:D-tyrosyl-tRNA(Tyr) deacylase
MKAVLQRVASASVTVDKREVGAIRHGLLALIGVEHEDGPNDVAYVAGKVRELRVFEDEHGKMNRSVVDTAGAVLVVSQFTVLGDCRRGRRPSFDAAAPPAIARAVYESLVSELRLAGLEVATGEFQAMMQVALVNDGPVTLLLDSRRRF